MRNLHNLRWAKPRYAVMAQLRVLTDGRTLGFLDFIVRPAPARFASLPNIWLPARASQVLQDQEDGIVLRMPSLRLTDGRGNTTHQVAFMHEHWEELRGAMLPPLV